MFAIVSWQINANLYSIFSCGNKPEAAPAVGLWLPTEIIKNNCNQGTSRVAEAEAGAKSVQGKAYLAGI